ncbi:MAG TPA: SpoIIE family protein phosphatase [Alphaproteobacteria bacterium]|nr:SpoIIE family protein phosphatase [Alphaproteobacteria bacterium]
MTAIETDDHSEGLTAGSGRGGTGPEADRPPRWWRRSLLVKVNSALAVACLLVGVLAALASAEVVGQQQRATLTRHAEMLASVEASALAVAVAELDARAATEMAEALMEMDPAVLRLEVWARSPTTETRLADLGIARSKDVVVVTRPVEHRTAGRIGELRMVYSFNEADRMAWRALVPMLVIVLLTLTVTLLVISGLIHRLVLAPLGRLTQGAARIAGGDYTVRLSESRADEIGLLTGAFNRMARTVERHTATLEERVVSRTVALNQINATLAEANRRITDSINYARLIQKAILPPTDGVASGISAFCVMWQPRETVGGDFYFYRRRGGRFLVGIIDCSGHGVPGAFMTMAAKAILDRTASDPENADPASMLMAANRVMRATLHRNAERGFDNGFDIGLCLCDPEAGRITFAGARISLFCVDAAGTTELRGDNHSLGYQRSRDDYVFTNHVVEAPSDRRFYMTTDGFLDQAGGDKGFGFGTRRFIEMLEAHRDVPLSKQREAFESCLNAYMGDQPQRDDITLLGFALASGAAIGPPP